MQNKELVFSVLVVTYNSEWDKTKQTLLSIIQQDKVSFEVVIADDGSKNNNFDKIVELFKEKSFSNYKLVVNKENKGTVKNFLSGLDVCSGQYIKPLSPGDFFYSNHSLYNAWSYITDNDAAVYFGSAAFYGYDNGFIKTFSNQANPKDIRPYRTQNYTQIRRNYFIRRDSILGASVVYKTDIIKKYISILSEFVKYAEDYSIYLILADGEKVDYMSSFDFSQEYFIWYESGSGISRQKTNKWQSVLWNELSNVYKYLSNNTLIDSKYHRNFFSTSKLKRFVLQMMTDPVYYLLSKIRPVPKKGWAKIKPEISLFTNTNN